MTAFVVGPEDPASPDVQELLALHMAFAKEQSPPEDVHTLDVAGLQAEQVSFFSIRVDGELLGVGALKQLDPERAEIKSMHTATAARGRGVARALLEHLVATARDRRYAWVGLETGSMAAFAPARKLYASAGFTECEPFGDYSPSPYSAFMSRDLGPERNVARPRQRALSLRSPGRPRR